MKVWVYFFTVLFLGLLFFSFSLMFSYQLSTSSSPKSSSFECGFQPFTKQGVPFSMPFFLLSLVFLLFDVEILLVCLMPLFCFFGDYIFFYSWVLVFMILFATFYEWGKGVLEWI